MRHNFRACPRCKSKEIDFPLDHKLLCKNCDFVFFHNVAASVAVTLVHGDKLLAVRRNQNPQIGKWDLPGGFVDPYEQVTQTCAREIHEELGYTLQKEDFLFLAGLPNQYTYESVLYHTMDLFFLASVPSMEIPKTAPAEIQAYQWIQLSEIQQISWAFVSMQNFFANGTNIAVISQNLPT